MILLQWAVSANGVFLPYVIATKKPGGIDVSRPISVDIPAETEIKTWLKMVIKQAQNIKNTNYSSEEDPRLYNQQGERMYFPPGATVSDLLQHFQAHPFKIEIGPREDFVDCSCEPGSIHKAKIHNIILISGMPTEDSSSNSNITVFKTFNLYSLSMSLEATYGDLKKRIIDLFPSKDDFLNYSPPTAEDIIIHDGELIAPATNQDSKLLPCGYPFFVYVRVSPSTFYESTQNNRLVEYIANFETLAFSGLEQLGTFEPALKFRQALMSGLLGPFSQENVNSLHGILDSLAEKMKLRIVNSLACANQNEAANILMLFGHSLFQPVEGDPKYNSGNQWAVAAYRELAHQISDDTSISISTRMDLPLTVDFHSEGKKFWSTQVLVKFPLGGTYKDLKKELSKVGYNFSRSGIKQNFKVYVGENFSIANESLRVPMDLAQLNVTVPQEYLDSAEEIFKSISLWPEIKNIKNTFNTRTPEAAKLLLGQLLNETLRQATRDAIEKIFAEFSRQYFSTVKKQLEGILAGTVFATLYDVTAIYRNFLTSDYLLGEKEQIDEIYNQIVVRRQSANVPPNRPAPATPEELKALEEEKQCRDFKKMLGNLKSYNNAIALTKAYENLITRNPALQPQIKGGYEEGLRGFYDDFLNSMRGSEPLNESQLKAQLFQIEGSSFTTEEKLSAREEVEKYLQKIRSKR